MENATAVGSNSVAEIFSGRIRVTGNLSIYFQDAVFRDYFNAESLVSIVMVLATNATANSDFVSFTMPSVKLINNNPHFLNWLWGFYYVCTLLNP